MPEGSQTGADFDSGLRAWCDRLGLVRDVVRQELVWRQLADHLPPTDTANPVPVLDVGCGQGDQLVRLARNGYQATGVDPSPTLLAVAAETVAKEPPDVQGRVILRDGDIDTLEQLGTIFEVVCCHGVVTYLPSLQDAIAKLVAAVVPGGLLSVLSKNRANLALRAAMLGDWVGAIEGFRTGHYTNHLGVEHARADEPDEVISALRAAGAQPIEWYGVRLFTDHWPDVEPPVDLELILQAEQLAGERDPYRQLCSATHVVARTGLVGGLTPRAK